MAIQEIQEVYKGYFQKSKVFLYPLLEHRKGSGVNPLNTYMAWENMIHVRQNQLICVFFLRNDQEFLKFEEKQLYGHNLFKDYYELEGQKAVYTFDLTCYEKDFKAVLEGRYSELSPMAKNKIENYFGTNSANYGYVYTYLYPEKHYEKYASLLCANEKDLISTTELLKTNKELCIKPDEKKETLNLMIKESSY